MGMKLPITIAILVHVFLFRNAWSETLHPELVLPAIGASRSTVQGQIERQQELLKSLKPDETVLSFDPFGQIPADETLPQSAEDFRFWEIEDDETFGLFIESLSFEFDMADYRNSSEFDELPIGYGIVRYVVRFEIHSRFSGWLALENVGSNEMEQVFAYYRKTGMPEEAEGLEKAEVAWYLAQEQKHEENEAAGSAYRTIANPYSDADERWDKILKQLRQPSLWLDRN